MEEHRGRSSNAEFRDPGLTLLEPKEAVAYLRTNRNRLIEWTRSGELPVVRFGERRILYRLCDLDDFITSRVDRGQLGG